MIQFFPSNANSSAAVQAYVRAGSDVDVANIRAQQAQAEVQAQMQNQNQQRFFQQQQAQQQNDLQRQQLANQDFFNRGRLTNEGKSLDAQLASANQQKFWKSSEAQKDRDLQEKIAGNRYPAVDWRTQELASGEAQIADAANNLATLSNQRIDVQKQLDQLGQAKDMLGKKASLGGYFSSGNAFIPGGEINYFRQTRGADQRARGAIPSQVPIQDIETDKAIEGAGSMLKQKADALDAKIKALSDLGVSQHVIPTESGQFISTFKPSVFPRMTGTNLPTATVTNAPASGFFSRTNAPAVNSQAVLAEARAAIQSGKDPVAVRQRLLQMNINPDF